MADIFISYKRERAPYAERLAVILEAYGCEVWWDYELIGGERFRTTIEQEINKAKLVIVLWDTLAINSGFVIDEAALALKQSKLLQVVLEDVEPPMGFRSADHRLSLIGWSGGPEHEAFARVLRAATSMIGMELRRPGRLIEALSANLGRLPPVTAIEEVHAVRDTSEVDGDGDGLYKVHTPSEREQLREETFFQSCGSAEEFEVYLNRYPNGHFADLAKAKIVALDRAWVRGLGLSDHDWSVLDRATILQKVGIRAARAEVEPIARRGVAEALTILGMVCVGTGDDEEAARLFRLAADSGFGRAQASLASMLATGNGVPRDEAAAFELNLKASIGGIAIAQNNLGNQYDSGLGVGRDPVAANKWYEKAAKQNLGSAQTNLALNLEGGIGVEKNESEAAALYRRAAEAGVSRAQFRLGMMLKNGVGVLQDEAEGVIWFRKAAEQGSGTAQFQLAYALANGKGTTQDAAEAVLWYKRAALQGLPGAQNNLGTMLESGTGTAKDVGEAIRWYRKAIDGGNGFAPNNLADLLERGKGVDKDLEEARRLFCISAERLNKNGQYNYGRFLEEGLGGEANLEEARSWYARAADQGHAKAIESLKRLDRQVEI